MSSAAYRGPQTNRWFSAKNESDIDIPPYACVQIKNYGKGGNAPDDDGPFGSFAADLDTYFKVERPGKEMAEDQNGSCLFFNSKKIIKANGGWGSVTRDFPALTLHDPYNPLDKLVPGQPCGPVQDEFFLKSSGFALTCQGHDENHWEGLEGSIPDGLHCIWVTNERVTLNPSRARSTIGGATVDQGDYINILGGGDFVQQDEEAENFNPLLKQFVNITVGDDGDGITYWLFEKPGLYLVSFDATISADKDAVADGTELEVEALLMRSNGDEENPEDVEAWKMKASVTQRVIQYYSGSSFPLTLVKAASIPLHLSMCHPCFAEKNDKLRFKNSGSATVTIANGQVSVTNLMQQNYRPTNEDEAGIPAT